MLVFGLSLTALAKDDSLKTVIFSFAGDEYGEDEPTYIDSSVYSSSSITMGLTNTGSVPKTYYDWSYFYASYVVKNDDNTPLFEAGDKSRLELNNFTFDFRWTPSTSTSTVYHVYEPSFVEVYVYYKDGSFDIYDLDGYGVYTANYAQSSISFEFQPEKDVTKVMFDCVFEPSEWSWFVHGAQYYLKLSYGNSSMSITQETESKEAGLLSGLLEWVKDIGGKVSDMAGTVSSGFANIGTWFAELPGKIWGVFEDGIKGLFVPSEESMANMSDKWDELLSDRFGAVYQVCSIVTESWSGIMSADETNTITVPEVCISLPGGSDFSFGGQEVKIVPDGFAWLASSVKMVVGMVCTYTFINGMLRRYDELMGVET